jgi:hypothetical protein
MTPQRTLLCRSRTFTGNEAAFLTPDGVDIDSGEHYEVIRRRVLFDDVHMVTLHTDRGLAFMILNGLLGGFFVALAVFIVSINFNAWLGALPFFIIGIVPFTGFLIRLAVGRTNVTVFGRRSRAVLRFGSFRKARARAVYGQLCAAVRRAQATPAPSQVSDRESFARPLPPGVPLPPP